jgi:hypothetical protein
VAIPLVANVSAPVVDVPANLRVTPPAGLIVVAPDATINTAVPVAKETVALVGIVMVPDPK